MLICEKYVFYFNFFIWVSNLFFSNFSKYKASRTAVKIKPNFLYPFQILKNKTFVFQIRFLELNACKFTKKYIKKHQSDNTRWSQDYNLIRWDSLTLFSEYQDMGKKIRDHFKDFIKTNFFNFLLKNKKFQ